ncbi:MAG: outer membrane beta-barrel protein [Marinilabilia sp.]
MKKFMLFAVAMLLAISASAQFQVGGGLTIGTKAGGYDDDGDEKLGIGVNLRGDYGINESWSVAPGFTFFFPSGPEGVDVTYWQLNADAHYHFHEEEGMGIYALGGLNYSYVKIESDYDGGEFGSFSFSADDSEIGLNLGIGTSMAPFYGELKYDTAFEQIALSAGIMF